MTALKITKRAKIAGLASMTLAATSLTVLFASHSALASQAPRGDKPPTTTSATTPAPKPSCTCQETPTATPTTVTPPPTTPPPPPPTTPAPTATPTALTLDRWA